MTTRPRKRQKLSKAAPRTISERKAPKTYRLAARKIAEARKILGAPSDTAAIEMALDMVTFRAELIAGVRAMSGTRLQRFDED
jgi:hypothetical protein